MESVLEQDNFLWKKLQMFMPQFVSKLREIIWNNNPVDIKHYMIYIKTKQLTTASPAFCIG